jgi:transcriptional regulator with XRE-family HTH domain
MPQRRRTVTAAQKSASRISRSVRRLRLVEEFEAREIGARIAQARRERGLTQEQLAEMGSFSKRSLQDYEAGLTIPYRHLRELGRLLKRKPEWFLYGPEPEQPLEALAELRELVEDLRDPIKELLEELRAARSKLR